MQAVPRLYSMAQKFTCEFCKIFANSYFVEHPRAAASEVNDLVYIKFYTYKKRCGDLLLCYFLKPDLIDFLPCYYWKYCYFNFLISLYESLFSQWYILSTIWNFQKKLWLCCCKQRANFYYSRCLVYVSLLCCCMWY